METRRKEFGLMECFSIQLKVERNIKAKDNAEWVPLEGKFEDLKLAHASPPTRSSTAIDSASIPLTNDVVKFVFPDGIQWSQGADYELGMRSLEWIMHRVSFCLTDGNGNRIYGHALRAYEVVLNHDEDRWIVSPSCAVFLCKTFEYSVLMELFLDEFICDPSIRNTHHPQKLLQILLGMWKGSEYVHNARNPKFLRETLQKWHFSNMNALMSTFSVRQIVEMIESAMCEESFVFVSGVKSHSMLHRWQCIHALLWLLRPFEWTTVFVPTLPSSLTGFLVAPTPFICGVSTKEWSTERSKLEVNAWEIDVQNGSTKYLRGGVSSLSSKRSAQEPILLPNFPLAHRIRAFHSLIVFRASTGFPVSKYDTIYVKEEVMMSHVEAQPLLDTSSSFESKKSESESSKSKDTRLTYKTLCALDGSLDDVDTSDDEWIDFDDIESESVNQSATSKDEEEEGEEEEREEKEETEDDEDDDGGDDEDDEEKRDLLRKNDLSIIFLQKLERSLISIVASLLKSFHECFYFGDNKQWRFDRKTFVSMQASSNRAFLHKLVHTMLFSVFTRHCILRPHDDLFISILNAQMNRRSTRIRKGMLTKVDAELHGAPFGSAGLLEKWKRVGIHIRGFAIRISPVDGPTAPELRIIRGKARVEVPASYPKDSPSDYPLLVTLPQLRGGIGHSEDGRSSRGMSGDGESNSGAGGDVEDRDEGGDEDPCWMLCCSSFEQRRKLIRILKYKCSRETALPVVNTDSPYFQLIMQEERQAGVEVSKLWRTTVWGERPLE